MRAIFRGNAVFETDAEMRTLGALLERSMGAANPHAQSIVTPERRLSAGQLVRYLQAVKHLGVATVSAKGEPYVSPVDAFFLHGRFVFSTAASSLRARHLARRPA